MRLRSRLALTVLAFGLPVFAAIEWYRRDTDRRLRVEGLVNLALGHMDAGARDACERAPERFGGPLGNLTGPRRPGPRGRRPGGPPGGGPGNGPPPAVDDRAPKDAARERGAAEPRGRGRGGPPEPPGDRRPAPMLWAFDADLETANAAAPALPSALRAGLEAGRDVVHRRLERDGRSGLEVAFRTAWTDGPCAVLWITEWEGARPRAGSSTQLLSATGVGVGLLLAALAAAWPLVRRIRGLTAAVEQSAAADYAVPVPDRGGDELADLARAFNRAGDEVRARMRSLSERSEALRQFLADTTHDVMTPLTVLQGHLGSLRRRAAEGEAVDEAALRACQEEAHYMASLLHNLTAAARLESGAVAIELTAQDLRPVVERAAARHRPMAESRGLALEVAVPAEPVVARADLTLLEQAVSNLVHNAVRHNATGQNVAVVLDAAEGRFELRVLDDGPGAPADVLDRLGDRRFRADEARQRTPEGQGLGLHIARAAAEAHGFGLRFLSPSSLGDAAHPGFEAVLEGKLVGR